MNQHDNKKAQILEQDVARSAREELEQHLLEVDAGLVNVRKKLTETRVFINQSTTPFTKHSPVVKKLIADAVTKEQVRIAKALRGKGWTYKQVGELLGLGINSIRVAIIKHERRVLFHERTAALLKHYKGGPMDDMSTEDLDVSVRTANCLQAAGIKTVGELLAISKDDLLRTRNFGRKSLRELEDVLRSMGYPMM